MTADALLQVARERREMLELAAVARAEAGEERDGKLYATQSQPNCKSRRLSYRRRRARFTRSVSWQAI